MNFNLLGIDYGLKNVGLAIATTPISEPLKVVDLEISTATISQLIDKHNIDAVVVGISEGDTAKKTKAFVRQLQIIINKPFYFQDETLSSQEVQEKLVTGTAKKSKRRKPVDHIVASRILQDFIDEHKPLEKLPQIDQS